mmetsp:Transcript_12332/g.33791  ORF Transcript_12332/g.33791 Transcript_12332/m.33791 type:complete len:359 (-) Transcript_12332:275-1351(-)
MPQIFRQRRSRACSTGAAGAPPPPRVPPPLRHWGRMPGSTHRGDSLHRWGGRRGGRDTSAPAARPPPRGGRQGSAWLPLGGAGRRAPTRLRASLITPIPTAVLPISKQAFWQTPTRAVPYGQATCAAQLVFRSSHQHVGGSSVRLVEVQPADWATPGLCQPLEQAGLMEAVPAGELAPRHPVLVFPAEADHALLLGLHLVGQQHSDMTNDLGVCPAVVQELAEAADQRPRSECREGRDEQHHCLQRLQHRGLYDKLADLLAVPRLMQQQYSAEAPAEEEEGHRGHADRPAELQHEEAQQPDLQRPVADLVLGGDVGGHAPQQQPHGNGQREDGAAQRHDHALPQLPDEEHGARRLQVV